MRRLYGCIAKLVLSAALIVIGRAEAGAFAPRQERLDEWRKLASEGKWKSLEEALRLLVKQAQGAEERGDRFFGLLYLHDALVAQGDFVGAAKIGRQMESTLSSEEKKEVDSLLALVRIRTRLLGRYRPSSFRPIFISAPDSYASMRSRIRAKDRAAIRSIAWSLLNESVLYGAGSAEMYLQAVTGLIALSGLEGDPRKADAMRQAALQLLRLRGGDYQGTRGQDIQETYDYYVLRRDSRKASFHLGPDPYWPKAKGQDAGMSKEGRKAVERYLELCRNTGADSALVVWKGKIVGEWVSRRYRGESINCASGTKSVASLLMGMLIGEGKIRSVYEPVQTFFPDWGKGVTPPPTLYRLLTMTAGIEGPFSPNGEFTDGKIADLNHYVVETMQPVYRVGTFTYSNYGMQILSPIMERAAGEPIHRYARRRLFGPLGFAPESAFTVDQKGGTVIYGGLSLKTREFARIGALALDGGRWRGKQVVPAGWIEALRYPVWPADDYSLLWWLGKDPSSLSMRGSLENNCVVLPDSDLIVVRQQRWDWTIGHDGYEDRAPQVLRRLDWTFRRRASSSE